MFPLGQNFSFFPSSICLLCVCVCVGEGEFPLQEIKVLDAESNPIRAVHAQNDNNNKEK